MKCLLWGRKYGTVVASTSMYGEPWHGKPMQGIQMSGIARWLSLRPKQIHLQMKSILLSGGAIHQ